MIETKIIQIIKYIHTCEETIPVVTTRYEVDAREDGKIPFSNYCPNCGESLPQWISEEAKEEARPGFIPCECGAAAKKENDYICTNPICKYYGQKAR